MHLLTTTSTSFDDIVEPVDLGQSPGDVVVLSFADSDLAALAAAWSAERDAAAERAPAQTCATCAIRCRSISGSSASAVMPR